MNASKAPLVRFGTPATLRPYCHTRHVDEGVFATKPHHTHACQGCGRVWRPAIVPTVGVLFLPGFKNDKPGVARERAVTDRVREAAKHLGDMIATERMLTAALESMRCEAETLGVSVDAIMRGAA